MRILRLLRGIFATAGTWAVAWTFFSMIPIGLATLFGADLPARVLGAILISQAFTGAINGGVFASLLALAGRRRTFASLSMPWFAAWGAVGGVLFPLVARTILVTGLDGSIPIAVFGSAIITNALVGAGCASLSLALARRTPELSPGESVADDAIDAGAVRLPSR